MQLSAPNVTQIPRSSVKTTIVCMPLTAKILTYLIQVVNSNGVCL